MTAAGPLTLGTAGHIDHGKTALVRALTGVDTDRLPEERQRGISIALGYAPLRLPSGRSLSLIDVPGHERFVKTMVAGATGIDLYLMVIAADDGVMPQTIEHAAVLSALGISAGVVAITKADLADPAGASAEARQLLPHASAVIACSAVTGTGVTEVASALDALAGSVPTRAQTPDEPLLHIDRSFSVDGIGTVVTGTLWSGTLHVGDHLSLLPGGRDVRVRSLQVHDEPRPIAEAGQRVAVNLVGVRAKEVHRGDAITTPGRVIEATTIDCALTLHPDAKHNERVQVHHGTRDAPARLAKFTNELWQLRLEQPLLAADGDRVVVRRLSPPDTLGGGTILDVAAAKHGRRPEVMARLRARAAGQPDPVPVSDVRHLSDRPVYVPPAEEDLDPAVLNALLAALRDADLALVHAASLDPEALAVLRSDGRAVRVSGQLYTDADTATRVQQAVIALIESNGSTSLAEVRDALGTGRKSAQAFLEYLDTQRITRREPDDRRVLRRSSR